MGAKPETDKVWETFKVWTYEDWKAGVTAEEITAWTPDQAALIMAEHLFKRDHDGELGGSVCIIVRGESCGKIAYICRARLQVTVQ